jgi:hypothetical protein
VIKLDVEGVEIEALSGAQGLLQRDCVVICEEHGLDRTHGITRHLIEALALGVFVYDEGERRFMRLDRVERLDRSRSTPGSAITSSRLQRARGGGCRGKASMMASLPRMSRLLQERRDDRPVCAPDCRWLPRRCGDYIQC